MQSIVIYLFCYTFNKPVTSREVIAGFENQFLYRKERKFDGKKSVKTYDVSLPKEYDLSIPFLLKKTSH